MPLAILAALLALLLAGAPAGAATRHVYRGTMLNESRISFVLGADRRVRGLDVASMQLLCSDSTDRHARIFVAEQGERGIPVDAGGRMHGTFRLHATGISGTAEMKATFSGAAAKGWVRARVTVGGADCDSGSAQFTARRATATRAAVKAVVRTGVANLAHVLVTEMVTEGAEAPDLVRGGRAIARAAQTARRTTLASVATTAAARRARTLAARGFRHFVVVGEQLALVGRYMPTDDPRGDAAIERVTSEYRLGRADLRRAGKLLGIAVRLPGF